MFQDLRSKFGSWAVPAIRMQADLADLLDQHAAARQLMRHLDVDECALRRGDLSPRSAGTSAPRSTPT